MFFGAGGKVDLLAAKIPAEDMGREWCGPSGIVANDFLALSGSQEERRQISFLRASLEPAGVAGVADFTYWQKASRLSQVSVRIYVFHTPEQCHQWLQDNCQAPGWEALYRKVDKPGCVCFDDLAGTKRIAATGRIVISASSSGGSNSHLRLLDMYLQRLW